MIARMLSRYADTRLRAELDKTRQQRERLRDIARTLASRNKQLRAALLDEARAVETQAALTERWRLIAQGAQADLAAERARTQETHQ